MNAYGFIFARGGSKGLPGKNVRQLAGKPLIAWAIEHARSVKRLQRVLVSTDSEQIAEIAREFGGEVPFLRPAALAMDESPEWLAWRHALEFLRTAEGAVPDVMVSVPTTAPLRVPEDIERCLDAYEHGDADVVVTMTEAHRSPYFNMVTRYADGTIGLVSPSGNKPWRRQDAPVVYDLTTVAYVMRSDFVLSRNSIFDGRVRGVLVPIERAIDIDTLLDFDIADYLLTKRVTT